MLGDNIASSTEKESSSTDLYNRLSFEAALFAAARASSNVNSSITDTTIPREVGALLKSRLPPAPPLPTAGGALPEAEVFILSAVEGVLGAYREMSAAPLLAAHPPPPNLRSAAVVLAHRPPLAAPVLACLFQLCVTLTRHAAPAELDREGCRLLVCLLELLACLPRGSGDGGMQNVLSVARITARNVMRRVVPRIFHSATDVAFNSNNNNNNNNSPAIVSDDRMAAWESLRGLSAWVERQLLPLNVVSGSAAREELKKDRSLALSLLDFLLHEEASTIETSHRVMVHYLADAVAALLEAPEEESINGDERLRAITFLQRADRILNNSMTAAAPQSKLTKIHNNTSICNDAWTTKPNKEIITEESVREFLLSKDAAYVQEFRQLQQCIEMERDNQALLRRQLQELASSREGIRHELQQNLLDALKRNNTLEITSNAALMKTNEIIERTEEGAAHSTELWLNDMMGLLQPIEDLSVKLHEKRQSQRTVN